MAFPLVNFESVNVKQELRKSLKEARSHHIAKVKDEYEKDQRRKQKRKERGEDKWMLPSVDHRLETEEKTLKSKKKKKEKKKKKHKEKKAKKHKNRDDNSSSSDTEDESEEAWVEKEDNAISSKQEIHQPEIRVIKGPQLERDSWMTTVDILPTVTRQELKDRKTKEEEKNNPENNLLDKPGQHERELNPFWRDGGTGMPSTEPKKSKSSQSSHLAGDGGLSWLKRAYSRCEQKAKDEGISMEQAASETWGSLKKLEKMLKDAERIAVKKENESKQARVRSFEQNRNVPSQSWRKQQPNQRNRFQKPTDDDENRNISSKDRDCVHSRTREEFSSPNRNGSEKGKKSYDSRHDSEEKDYHYRYQSRRRSRSRSLDREQSGKKYDKKGSRSRSRSRSRERNLSSRKFERRKPRSRSRSHSQERRSSRETMESGKRFMKPGQIDRDTNYRTSHRSDRDCPSNQSWRKPQFRKAEANDDDKSDSSKVEQRSPNRSQRQRREPSPSSSSESSSDSSDGSDSGQEGEQPVERVTVLTEQEMNQLSAKLLKAEIMGDDDLVTKLTTQLEEARKVREEHKDDIPVPERSSRSGEGAEDVVLTVTDKRGLVRPLADRQHAVEPRGGRRKKQKVSTHDKQGNRERYFDDDDKFDLKKMVEREKMGTAEDQNSMFARLAGRISEKTDEDHEIDDVLLIRSAQKQSEAKTEERERSKAIFEHKKISTAMEKCHFCFENVAKHLIIAIGMKVYLLLPNCRSLTEGHCLIVPMTHVSASTAVDEDVWAEMQVFRKTLTKMFADRDLDVVFMETSMNLRRYPHMCIECVPVPREVGDMAPIYFKKAILESDTEWAQNKKLVDLREKNVRRSIPKGLPYFTVDFGLQGGFAHVIEAEHLFSHYFGKEIIGGILDVEHQLWRKPPRENFDDQRRKVLAFAEWWKPYDWTQKIKKGD